MSASEMERLLREIRRSRDGECSNEGHTGAGTYEFCADCIDAALSGSSAPQATNSEELLKALRAASGLLSDVRAIHRWCDTERGKDVRCSICVRIDAALSAQQPTPAEGGSQKGEP